jgi:hypothetical protein
MCGLHTLFILQFLPQKCSYISRRSILLLAYSETGSILNYNGVEACQPIVHTNTLPKSVWYYEKFWEKRYSTFHLSYILYIFSFIYAISQQIHCSDSVLIILQLLHISAYVCVCVCVCVCMYVCMYFIIREPSVVCATELHYTTICTLM